MPLAKAQNYDVYAFSLCMSTLMYQFTCIFYISAFNFIMWYKNSFLWV